MFNARTLSSEGSLAVLPQELSDIKWDIIGLSEVRTGEGFMELTSGHVLQCTPREERTRSEIFNTQRNSTKRGRFFSALARETRLLKMVQAYICANKRL